MTAATSHKSNSFFGTRFRNDIKDHSRLLIVNLILSLAGLPLACITACYYAYLDQIDSPKYLTFNDDGFLAASMIAFFLAAALGLVIALFSFRYLFKKSLTDMNYALPLSSKNRFFADYFSGLGVYLIPHIIAIIISIIILSVAQGFVDDIKELMSDHFTQIFLAAWIFILALTMFYTICVLALTFAGSTFEAIFSCFGLNAMIPAVIICTFFNIIQSAKFGLNSDSIFTSPIVTSTSPIGNMIYLAVTMEELSSDYWESGSNPVLVWSILTLIVTAIYILLAFITYRARKAEDVSKPYVFKWFYYLVLVSAVYCFLSLFLAEEAEILPAIIVSGIAWFIMEVITRRGFKRIWVGAICFIGAIALAFGFRTICDLSKGFGITEYIPSKAMVSSVTLSLNNSDNMISDINISDRTVIEDTLELHSQIIDRYKHPDNYTYNLTSRTFDNKKMVRMINDGVSVYITYSLRNGLKCTRHYYCTSDMTEKLLTDTLLTDEFAEKTGKKFYKNASREEHYTYIYDMPVIRSNNITLHDKFSTVSNSKNLKDDELKRLTDAYTQDLKNMTIDDLKKGDVWGVMSGPYNSGNFILSSFNSTINVLTDLGFETPEYSVSAMESDSAHNIAASMLGLYPETVLFANEDKYYKEPDSNSSLFFVDNYYYDEPSYGKYTVKENHTYIGQHNDYSKSYVISADVINFDDDMLELLDKATTLLIGDKIAATLQFNGQLYFIPDEGDNAELVERVYKKQFSSAIETDGYYYR